MGYIYRGGGGGEGGGERPDRGAFNHLLLPKLVNITSDVMNILKLGFGLCTLYFGAHVVIAMQSLSKGMSTLPLNQAAIWVDASQMTYYLSLVIFYNLAFVTTGVIQVVFTGIALRIQVSKLTSFFKGKRG